MTNREAIYQIKRIFKEVNADSRLTNRLVFSLLEKHTKWLISRESEKFNIVQVDSVFQLLKCVKVIEAPAIDPCCGIKSKCVVHRTKDKIPELFEDTNGVIVRDVLTIDGSQSLFQIKPSEWLRKQNNPWIPKDQKNKYFFYSEGYLYFPGGTWKMIEINGLFTKDISDINLCDDKATCEDETKICKKFLDKKFIIPKHLEAQMFDVVMKDLGSTYKKLPERSNEINKNDNK